MAPKKINIAMRGILCDVENMIFSCNLILAGCVLVAVVAQYTAKQQIAEKLSTFCQLCLVQ